MSQAAYPEVVNWARPLLYTNTAKLLYRRFEDRSGAIKHLRAAIALAREEHHETLVVELARLLFDDDQDAAVVDALSPIFGPKGHVSSDERNELLARTMLIIALFRLGRREEAATQLRRLRPFAVGAVESDSGPGLIERLASVLL
jgi:hypothetical protein